MKPVPNAPPTENLSGSIIAFRNRLADTTGAGDEAKALTPNTYERWAPPPGAVSSKFQTDTIVQANFIGIAAHALIGETLTFSTAETVGGALTDVDTVAFTDNGAVLLTFDTRTVAEIQVAGTLIAASEIGVLSTGEYLQMLTNIYGGHSPQSLSQKTNYQSVMSDTGQFLGRNVTRKGTRTEFSWQHLDPDWYRENFQPFVQSAVTEPFFIQWRPDKYPDEVEYAHTTNDISPTNMGGASGLMAVTMSVRGHSDI